MKNFIFWVLIICTHFITSCGNKRNIPNVSNIKIDLKVERFENDFFKINTNNTKESLDEINKKYPSFLPDYLYQILGLTPNPDSVVKQVNLFLKDSLYLEVYKEATSQYKNIDEEVKELTQALKITKYYFPKYQPPNKIYTFIGPLDGVGTAITSDHNFAIGLQGYLGRNYPAYQSGYIAQIYPSYKTQRFEKNYMATNCIKNVIEELFPNESKGRPLAERIIEEGRRLYVLDALLPYTADSVKTGYTQSQLKQCINNEKTIWAFFVQGNLLFEREPSIVSPYVTDGPKTQELSETAPGNIGQFTGWQIVKKWMSANPKTSLETLMKTSTMTIFTETNYNP